MLKRVTTDDRPETEARAQEKLRQQELLAEADRLYDRYVKPLESEHWGEYVVVAADGRMVRDASHREALRRGTEILGPGHHLFKIGDVVVGTIR